jgi:ubiquinone/menaquinone biosynthesis C-methylase UbiE
MSKKEQNFFDQLAERWDDIRSLNTKIIMGLVNIVGFREGDHVLDVGCGTGVLVPFVKKVIGDTGRITAVDFSRNMIARAIQKHKELTGITFIAEDIMNFRSDVSFDRIICFNFFPHVEEKSLFLQQMHGQLSDNGCLVIMHDRSRKQVNSIHSRCETVKNDHLLKGETIAEMLTELDYRVTNMIDNEEIYFVKAMI